MVIAAPVSLGPRSIFYCPILFDPLFALLLVFSWDYYGDLFCYYALPSAERQCRNLKVLLHNTRTIHGSLQTQWPPTSAGMYTTDGSITFLAGRSSVSASARSFLRCGLGQRHKGNEHTHNLWTLLVD